MRTIEDIQKDIDECRRLHSHPDCSDADKELWAKKYNHHLLERDDAEQAARNALPAGDHFAPIVEEAGGVLLDSFSNMSTEEKLDNLNCRMMHIEGFLTAFSKNAFSPLDNVISSALNELANQATEQEEIT